MRVAVCGKIGSGKSTVCKILQEDGYFVLSADKIYAEIIDEDESFVKEISTRFGIVPLVLEDKITLDRRALAKIVFADEKKRKELNRLTHKRVLDEMVKKSLGQKIAVCEVPLLFEVENVEKYFDLVVEVVRSEEEAIISVMARDNLSREEVVLRQNSQKKYVINGKIEHTFIYNDSSLEELILKVKALEKIF